MQCWLVAEEANQTFVSEAKKLHLLVVLAGVGAPLSVEYGVQWEGRIALHNVGQFKTRGEERVSKGPPTLRTVSYAVMLLSAPVLGDAISAEVVLTTKADRILVDAEADGTEELVLQRASHLQTPTLSGMKRSNSRRGQIWFNLQVCGSLLCRRTLTGSS